MIGRFPQYFAAKPSPSGPAQLTWRSIICGFLREAQQLNFKITLYIKSFNRTMKEGFSFSNSQSTVNYKTFSSSVYQTSYYPKRKMDSLALAAAVAQYVEIGFKLAKNIYNIYDIHGGNYRQQRFGSTGFLLQFLRLIDIQEVRNMHWNINTWKDEEVKEWKTSYMANCNAIGVAVGILVVSNMHIN
jgi:hypothetical protein